MMSTFYHQYVKPNIGLVFSLLGTLFNAFMVFFCKLLLLDKNFSPPIHPLHILVIRTFITYVCCTILLWNHPDFPLGPKGYRKYMVMRGVGGFFGVAGQYFALMYLTVSDTVVITFLGPTISSWMAYLFLKERYTRLEAVCGMVALLGVVLVAKPTFIFGDPNHASSTPKSSSGGNRSLESLSPGLRLLGTCEALVSCFGTGLSTCAMRVIGFNAHPVITVSFFSLVTFIFSLTGVIVLRLPLQMPHTLMQWGLLTTVGIAGFVMQYLSTMGLQREKASRAMTMSYTQLIYTTILEYLIFHHLPSFLSLLGSAIIMGSVLVVIVYKTEEEPVPEIDDTELTIYEDSHSLISSDSDK